ncbi:putative methyltransferase [Roseobacter litoralis Och 149]|uniref:Methyltransferase n=1 Tax=Roseobacter litoralis (strain ATCC 49566 / DSM 6996 / JCM 21268 / NBRC 15278 / OCh 149) TaxID=391595 RepID=F7ZJ74_ROSLO|nr:putative methyltransferase [Roseobacter litoralis Och 149]
MTLAPYHETSQCRICRCGDLAPVIDLGLQALTGRFPAVGEPDPASAPLELVRCKDCGLVQLLHSVDVGEMFSDAYGYRSGINATMTDHLSGISGQISERAGLGQGDIALDIGCNDGTLLKSYPVEGIKRLGIDPVAENFRAFYSDDIEVHTAFFNADTFHAASLGQKARAITSISMFYDLEDPGAFVGDIAGVLAQDGIWVLEQSYLPTMLEANSYDTICHEHLEYYALAQIDQLVSEKTLRIFDVSLNDINGGSFQIWVCHQDANYKNNEASLSALRNRESQLGLSTDAPFAAFRERVAQNNAKLKAFIEEVVADGKKVYVYGASTKGNVLLQYLDLGCDLLSGCAEKNPIKFGRRTPGTGIPIVPEAEARAAADYFLVLPWHFRDEFIARESEFLENGGTLIFPLPTFEIV